MKASHLLSLVLAIALVFVCAKFVVVGNSDSKDRENTEQTFQLNNYLVNDVSTKIYERLWICYCWQ